MRSRAEGARVQIANDEIRERWKRATAQNVQAIDRVINTMGEYEAPKCKEGQWVSTKETRRKTIGITEYNNENQKLLFRSINHCRVMQARRAEG